MKKIEFNNVMIEYNFGSPEPMDVRQMLGNKINQQTGDIALADLARSIYYSDGPVEIPDNFIEPIVDIIHNSGWIAAAKTAIINLLTKDDEIKEEE